MINTSISNIAWPAGIRERIYALLSREGVKGVEMALTKIAPWDVLDYASIAAEKQLIESYGLVVSSYQAIYFGLPELQLLADQDSFEKLKAHTVHVAQLAEKLSGGGVGVFGAPRNRRRGALNEDDAFELGADRFATLAEAVAPFGFVLGLEPAPTEYGGDFLQTTFACAQMVRTVAHQALQLHVDTGCLSLSAENVSHAIGSNADIIAHVHLSKPNLAPLNGSEIEFEKVFGALKTINYQSWVAIEMRETDNPEQAVCESLRLFD